MKVDNFTYKLSLFISAVAGILALFSIMNSFNDRFAIIGLLLIIPPLLFISILFRFFSKVENKKWYDIYYWIIIIVLTFTLFPSIYDILDNFLSKSDISTLNIFLYIYFVIIPIYMFYKSFKKI